MLASNSFLLTPSLSLSLRLFRLPSYKQDEQPAPILRTLFQVPYPVSPLLATLTKTAGVGTNNSILVQPRDVLVTGHFRLTKAFKSFPFTLLHTLLHAEKSNSLLFNRFRTLCQKTPGWGYPFLLSSRLASSESHWPLCGHHLHEFYQQARRNTHP